jgi:uncharacterized protein
MITPTLCIFHNPCADGFTAAWAVWTRFGDAVKFHPGVHGQPPPDVTGQHVVIVDFSYPRAVLERMAEQAASVLLLDHHHTAQRDLADLPGASWTWLDHVENAKRGEKIGVLFDMNRSGAMLTWDFFHPGEPIPKLVQHVEDRDLWRFSLPGTREIQSWLFSHEYDFQIWDGLALQLEDPETYALAIAEGLAIDRKHLKDVKELVRETQRRMAIGGYTVPVANLPYTMASDGAHMMADEGYPFAAAYFDRPDCRVFSLRSRRVEVAIDVGAIAKDVGARLGFSGGGHKHAAGFRAPLGWEGE